MKFMATLMVLASLFSLVACFAAAQSSDAELKTLRLTSIDTITKTALYVATRAVISGPGNATTPTQLEIGNDRIVQGMIVLQEDQKELEKLTERVKQEYGPEISLKKELTGNVALKVTVDGQSVWEHQIFTGNQGMPFQVTVPANASATLKVQMHFTPAGQGQQSSTAAGSSQSRIFSFSNGIGSGSQQLTASYSTEQSNNSPGEFAVEQTIQF